MDTEAQRRGWKVHTNGWPDRWFTKRKDDRHYLLAFGEYKKPGTNVSKGQIRTFEMLNHLGITIPVIKKEKDFDNVKPLQNIAPTLEKEKEELMKEIYELKSRIKSKDYCIKSLQTDRKFYKENSEQDLETLKLANELNSKIQEDYLKEFATNMKLESEISNLKFKDFNYQLKQKTT